MDEQNKGEQAGEGQQPGPAVELVTKRPEGTEELLGVLLRAAVGTDGGLASYLRGEGRVTGEAPADDGKPGPQRMAVLFDLAMADFEFSCALGPQYGQVHALYAQATSASKCPCGSGRQHGDCCKTGERLAGQAVRSAVEQKKQAAKRGDGKTSSLSAAETVARQVGSDWALVLYPSKDGVLRMETIVFKAGTSGREVQPMPLEMVAGVLTDMYHEAQQQMTMRRVMDMLQPQQGNIRRVGPKWLNQDV